MRKYQPKKSVLHLQRRDIILLFLSFCLFIISGVIFYNLKNPQTLRSRAATLTNKAPVASTVKWNETVFTPTQIRNSQIVSNRLSPQRIIHTSQSSSPIATGTWEGRTVRVIKNESLPDGFRYPYGGDGVSVIQSMADDRLFIGGINILSIKDPQDALWSNLTTYTFKSPNLNKIQYVVPTNGRRYEVYFGNSGVFRMKSDATFEEVKDPTDSSGFLRNVRISSFGRDNAVFAYRPNELYLLDNGALRKWTTPSRPLCGFQDEILGMFTDPESMETFGFINEIYSSAPPFCGKQTQTYLYKFSLSEGVNPVLVTTRLGKVNNMTMPYKISLSKRQDLTGQKIVYWYPKNISQFSMLTDFSITGQDMTVKNYYVHLPNENLQGSIASLVIEKSSYGNSDRIWVPVKEVRGVYAGTNFNLLDGSQGVFTRTTDTSILANTYITDITINSSGTVYTAHKFLSGNQGNNALITIFEIPTVTPTPTPVTYCDTDNTPCTYTICPQSECTGRLCPKVRCKIVTGICKNKMCKLANPDPVGGAVKR